MLHIDSSHQGIYAPLNQAMTDSDSEEQLFLRHQQNDHNKSVGKRIQPTQSALLHIKGQNEIQLKLMQQKQGDFKFQQKVQLHTQTPIDNNILQPSSYTTNMQNTFRSVMMSDGGGEPGSSISSFNSDYDDRYAADNVAILNHHYDIKNADQPLSPARKFCFVISLLVCFLVAISFMWLIPCTAEGTCPALVDRVKTNNWLSKYTNIELKGGVNVVAGLRNLENNLIFLYRGDTFFSKPRSRNNKRNGVLSLIGSSGAVAWYDEMHDEPIGIDCTLIDINLNGQPDCLVLDEYGEIGIINPISGQWYWKYKERSAYKIDSSDFPVILPDLDGDGVLEILVVTSSDLLRRTKILTLRNSDIPEKHPKAPRNFLRILSGHTGALIGEGLEIHECDLIQKLHLDSSSQTVTYSCLRNRTETRYSRTIGELFALVTNKSLMGSKLPSTDTAEISQHYHSGLRRDIDAQRNIYSLSGRELVVENRGKCPENCNVTFILSDGRNGKVEILHNFTQMGVYGMAPVQWHFKNSQPEMSGFVMKFWKWVKTASESDNKTSTSTIVKDRSANDSSASEQELSSDNKPKPLNFGKNNPGKLGKTDTYKPHIKPTNNKTFNSGPRNKVHHFNPDIPEFNVFDHLIQKRESYSFSSEVPDFSWPGSNTTKRKVNRSNHSLQSSNSYKMEMITESVILVLFIGANTEIENTSHSNIIQFCHNENDELLCQPDLNNQENSILIADIDQDGTQELVSFTSTYVDTAEDTFDYRLTTYVRLLRLEEELPAFYRKGKK